MRWAPAEFKGKTVWVEVDEQGEMVVKGGEVPSATLQIRAQKFTEEAVFMSH